MFWPLAISRQALVGQMRLRRDMSYGMKFNTEAKALGFQDKDILCGNRSTWSDQ